MKSLADVIDTLRGITESASKSTTESLYTKEVAALAAQVLDELVLCMLTIPTGQGSLEESYVRYVIRHFENSGITLRSLETLLYTLRIAQQYPPSAASR